LKVAFYAPLKPPDHPVPSGDRTLARGLLEALRAAGHDVSIASHLRSYDAAGDAVRQARLATVGARLAQRLVARYRAARERPGAWFTYHLYHKAPDWLGPAVSRALSIPYLVAEASVATRQQDGRWACGHAGAVAAIRAADAVLCVNPRDVDGVRRVRGAVDADAMLAPFIDLDAFAAPATSFAQAALPPRQRRRVRLVTVAMMRDGAKLASYRVLAASLACIAEADWELVVIGDGAARGAVEAAFAGCARERIRFAGTLPTAALAAELRAGDLFLWPAIDEAFGMVFIEAQACGLPVVGAATAGVAAVVDDGRTGLLVPPGDVAAFAAATLRLVADAGLRARMARAAVAYVHARHGLPGAAARIDALLRQVVAARARRAQALPAHAR
jgi:glycosyltransferase involved in cell wall biosynthesis